MTDTIQIGITGLGFLGKHVARGFEKIENTEIHAIADIDDDNRDAAGERFNVSSSQQYEEHETMLDNADLDGVVIATPHVLHYDQTVEALKRDIDTLCEKPLCTNIDDVKDLIQRSDQSNATLMVGYQRHLDPAFAIARELLSEAVGDPQFITAEVTQDWISGTRGSWRANPDLSGGGQLYDTGSHLLDVVLWTTDLTPVEVNALMLFDDEEHRVDKQAGINIMFENGAVATVGVSGDSPAVREHLHVWGDEGAFYVSGEDWNPRDIYFIDPDGSERRPGLEDRKPRNKSEAFVDVIRNDVNPPATPRDALKVTAVTEAAYESARRGETVEVELDIRSSVGD